MKHEPPQGGFREICSGSFMSNASAVVNVRVQVEKVNFSEHPIATIPFDEETEVSQPYDLQVLKSSSIRRSKINRKSSRAFLSPSSDCGSLSAKIRL